MLDRLLQWLKLRHLLSVPVASLSESTPFSVIESYRNNGNYRGHNVSVASSGVNISMQKCDSLLSRARNFSTHQQLQGAENLPSTNFATQAFHEYQHILDS